MALQTGSGFRKEHLLMPNRVREVLLVSSRYDAFVLEEDGHLTTVPQHGAPHGSGY